MSPPADYALGKGIKLAVWNPTAEIEKAAKATEKAVKDAQKAAEKAASEAVAAAEAATKAVVEAVETKEAE